MTLDLAERRARRANGLPGPSASENQHWALRVLTSPWTWVTLGLTAIYAGCLWWMYSTSIRATVLEEGVIPGLNPSAIRRAAQLAWPTLLAWVVVFVCLDRFRPMRTLLWWLAVGWGGAVATALSMMINTWAGQHLSIVGEGDPASGARTAVFIAPFVEEATKATVLFGIAIVLRYRLVSRIQAAALAGLSAAGFAFTENILYYSRVIVYSSTTIEAGDPQAALNEIVLLRGLKTAFGHPLFTILTAIGLIIALRARSKVVRIIAPLAGYLLAALAHMVFNFFASVGMDANVMAVIGWIIALSLAFHLIRQVLAEGRRHRDRLGDYVMMGWLPPEAVVAFSRQRTRWASLRNAVSYGWRPLMATFRLQRAMSELAQLRDAQVRGAIDEAGDGRARELLATAHALWPVAITDPKAQRFQFPKIPNPLRRLRRRRQMTPAPTASMPLGSPVYSPVDPRWGPPKG
ncbi:MAG: PrsW family glutamic-type intramembrane protease [Propioniciclava sp.]|uniref:PrsW family intramembrane metalloprotease n=1 Tax=Propioniciclava sp. TaxID=2038686 RepID=UPI0039E484A7